MSGEVIIDGKRKRSWPKDLKRQIVAESKAAGMTVCEVARRYDIEPSQLFHWRKQFRDEVATTVDFLPVEVSAGGTDAEDGANKVDERAAPGERAEIQFPNGRQLKVTPGKRLGTYDRALEVRKGN